jgi:hypothetical protein
MRRVPSRRPTSLRRVSPERGTVIVVYENLTADEAAAVEKNVRAAFGDWCPDHQWQSWQYDPEKQVLNAVGEFAADDPDQITTGLFYLAWDALDHFSKVVVYLDALVWEHPFQRGDAEEYQVYLEETRLPAEREKRASSGLFTPTRLVCRLLDVVMRRLHLNDRLLDAGE